MNFVSITCVIVLCLNIITPCDSLTTPSPNSIFPQTSSTGDATNTKNTHLIFPGGGIFFYWQAGCISYLREKNYSLLDDDNTVKFTGASAGALCATLAVTNVDFEEATELALRQSEEEGIWDRPLGLYGIWGGVVERWLDELIPADSVESLQDNRLSLLLTEVPSFQTKKVSQFESKEDLIRCNMGSVHIPLFMDGKLTTEFRSKPVIDGSFRAELKDYHALKNSKDVIFFDWTKDPILNSRTLIDAVSTISKEGIWDLLEQGRSYAVTMEKRGKFSSLNINQ
mmetsp:Transcript_15159/g.22917  ORF Transcript_15159/g.22917 Transcript_15159/m.22917 type:complete len:283 (-) Transcript_15159:300-1148(-)